MYRTEIIVDQHRLAAVREAWDEVAQLSSTPFQLSAWLRPWFDAFSAPRSARAVIVWRGTRLAAGIVLVRRFRQWSAPVNDHAPGFNVVAEDDSARRRLLVDLVAQSNALAIPALADDDPTADILVEAAREHRRWALVQQMAPSLTVDTTGSVQEYRAGLSPHMRREMARLRRKAEREYGLAVMPFAVPDDLESELDAAFALEQSGWKGRRGTAIADSPNTERFYRGIAKEFAARGSFRMSHLLLDGAPAAMAMTIIHQRRAFTLKVGYDEQFRSIGPGFVLLNSMVEECFALGLDAYEFSGPPAEYEWRFASGQHDHRSVRIYRANPLNASRLGYHRRLRAPLRAIYRAALARKRPTRLGPSTPAEPSPEDKAAVLSQALRE